MTKRFTLFPIFALALAVCVAPTGSAQPPANPPHSGDHTGTGAGTNADTGTDAEAGKDGMTARFGPESATVPILLVDFLDAGCSTEITIGRDHGVRLAYRTVRYPANFTAAKLTLHVRRFVDEQISPGGAAPRGEEVDVVRLVLPANRETAEYSWPAREPGRYRFRLTLAPLETGDDPSRIVVAESRHHFCTVHPQPDVGEGRINVERLIVRPRWREWAGGAVRLFEIELEATIRFGHSHSVAQFSRYERRPEIVRSEWAGVMPPSGEWVLQPPGALSYEAGAWTLRERFCFAQESWPRELAWRIDSAAAEFATAASESGIARTISRPVGATPVTILLVTVALPQYPSDAVLVTAHAGSPYRPTAAMRVVAADILRSDSADR